MEKNDLNSKEILPFIEKLCSYLNQEQIKELNAWLAEKNLKLDEIKARQVDKMPSKKFKSFVALKVTRD